MRIGLDLSVVQTPHRMRGIGSVAINFMKALPKEALSKNTFIIYLYKNGVEDAQKILELDDFRGDYEIRYLKQIKPLAISLPGKLRKLNGLLNSLFQIISTYRRDPRIKQLNDIDVFLQFDQMQPPPKGRGLKTAVILYDLIPFVMETDYLWSYRTARHFGDSRKSSLRKAFHRKLYKIKAKQVAKKTDCLIAISAHTKNDYVRLLGIEPKKISVVHLGINQTAPETKHSNKTSFEQYYKNSWGYIKKYVNLSQKPFLLFVGGADPRRKLQDLVAAFNNLKAQGHDIRLVLAGDTMKGAEAIPTLPIQKSLLTSSYRDNIVFLGFVTDQQREWLYEHTLAFVYPSVYEGFGLPILEAMRYGTPVITYDNSSIREIAGEAAIYAKDSRSIESTVEQLIKKPALKKHYSIGGKEQSRSFSWQTTSTVIMKILT